VKLIPQRNKPFELFRQQGRIVSEIVGLLGQLAAGFGDFKKFADRAKELERAGDKVAYEIIADLQQTWTQPLDREDIHPLAHGIDEITDNLERTFRDIFNYNITEKPYFLDEFVLRIRLSAEHLNVLLGLFDQKKYSQPFAKSVFGIREIEHEADGLYSDVIRKLFTEETNLLTVIKTSKLAEDLENILDSFQGAANRIEGITLKWS
jgi:predicted phosphate transport protein (TIGR00153 family)